MEIHGVVVTRDDWGVLALSISNALNHVDVVHVLNHGSKDQTTHGLEILKEIWGVRLKVYTAKSDLLFKQSLLTNMVVSLAESEGADWIYVFDSDEFLISKPDFSLKEELAKLSESVVAVRYKISNYISTFDFDKNNLNDYKHLIYKSNPSQPYDSTDLWDSLYSGELSCYDIDFVPKIIFRANKNLLVSDGAHHLSWIFSGQSVVNTSTIDCAHLMLVSKDILPRKSSLGESHINMGLPRHHGLRNQLIYRLDCEDRLDWFWHRHSIQTGQSAPLNPKHMIDHTLVNSLHQSIERLKEKFGGTTLAMLSGVPLKHHDAGETLFAFDAVLQMCESFHRKIDLFSRMNKSR